MATITYQSEFTGAQMDSNLSAVATLQSAVTALETAVAAKYTKPSGGIPSTDMDSDVQSALALALTSIQSLSDYYTKAQVDALTAAIASSVNATSGVTAATLPTASASTVGKIYYIGPTDGVYDRYVTSYDGSIYSWLSLGTTEIDLTQYATAAELSQLEQEVNGYDLTDTDVTPSYTTGYYYGNSGTTITMTAHAGSKYSGTITNTSTPPSDGIDISGYIGRTIKITVASMSAGSSRKTVIAKSDMTFLDGFAEETYTADTGASTYSKEFVVPADSKWLFWSATGNLVSIAVEGSGHVDGMVDALGDLENTTAGMKEKTDLLIKAQTANLFNKNDEDVKIGYYLAGETWQATSSYNVSGYVPVNASTTYYAAMGGCQYRFASYYDSTKTYLSNTAFSSGSASFTTPANCAYVRVTFYADTYATAQIAATSTSYVAYKLFLETPGQGTTDNAIATLKDLAEMSGNVLFGKKWVACGDSFTHGDFSDADVDNYHIETGKYAGQYKVYPFLIGNRNNMVIVNEAVNGSPMTYIDGTRYEFSTANGRYTQIASDADYITLKFGINDDTAHLNAPIGTIDDNTNETFYGAWNIVMNYIINNHPQAKIGIIVTNGSQLPYVNAIIAIAEKWGVSYLNEATDPKCSFMFRSNRTDVVESIRTMRNEHWFVDALENNHPNALAHEYESTVIEAWLRTL